MWECVTVNSALYTTITRTRRQLNANADTVCIDFKFLLIGLPNDLLFLFFYFPAELIRLMRDVAAEQQQAATHTVLYVMLCCCCCNWQVSRGVLREGEWRRRRRGRGGAGERNNHWERDVLSTGAPANCLAHELVGYWIWMQLCLQPQGCWHLSSPDDSSV